MKIMNDSKKKIIAVGKKHADKVLDVQYFIKHCDFIISKNDDDKLSYVWFINLVVNELINLTKRDSTVMDIPRLELISDWGNEIINTTFSEEIIKASNVNEVSDLKYVFKTGLFTPVELQGFLTVYYLIEI